MKGLINSMKVLMKINNKRVKCQSNDCKIERLMQSIANLSFLASN